MSVKIRISYETEAELDEVVKLLSPGIKRVKKSQNAAGKHKKSYVEMEGDFLAEPRTNQHKSTISSHRRTSTL